MKTTNTSLQFAGSNSNTTNITARLDFKFKAIIIALASIIFGFTSAFAQSGNCTQGNASAQNIKYLVNGKEVSGLRGNVKAGSNVRVIFTTAKGTNQTRFSLVSYKAPGPTFDANTADQQKVFEYETGLFKPGKHIMQIQIPNCYFQVDFVKGCVIEKLGPAGSNNFYSAQNRLIDADNGGTNGCKKLGVDVVIDNPFQVGFPDTTVIHNVCFKNTSKTTKDEINIAAISANGWKLELYDENNDKLMATDNDGDGKWDYVNASFDTDKNGEPDTKKLNSDDQECLNIMVYIPADALVGTLDTLEVYGFSAIDERVFDMENAFTEVDEPFVLPVKLLSFTAGFNGKVVRLDWATATEINNDYFSIERSKDGKEFEEVLVIRGAGNSNSISKYNIEDKEPMTGVSYYRLRQTDFDGQTEAFNVVMVNNSKVAQTISIQQEAYPNPFSEKFNLSFNIAERGEVVITMNDIQGRQIRTMNINADKGTNSFEFSEGESLPKGIYFINLYYNNEVVHVKMIKNGSDAITGL